MSSTVDGTIDYYEKNADLFAGDTLNVNFATMQDRFLMLLPSNSLILDFGCGSGRDTRYFLDRGYRVEAVDGSEKLCEIAHRNTGIEVRHMLFSELDVENVYDGIWACASILHVPRALLPDILERMEKALKKDGIIYVSFKYGSFEGLRGGRYFTDFTEESFADLIRKTDRLLIEEEWISTDVRSGREDQKWLNIILRRTNGAVLIDGRSEI